MIPSRKISRLLNDLVHPDPSKRRHAAEALSEGDERGVYPLIKALKDSNSGVQDAAMRSLISIGGEVTAYMVMPLLRDEPLLRNTALIILKEIGRPSIPLLKPLLNDKDDDVRKFAIDLVCEIGECEYPEELARLLVDDPNPNVRASAAKAIGILQYKDAMPQLIQALNDEEWVCFSALDAIAMLNDEAGIDAIISLLDSPSDAVRFAAIESIGKCGFSKGSSALVKHMSKADGFEKIETVKSLIKIGVTPSMPGISDVLLELFDSSDWDDKFIALKGLIDLRETSAIYPIIETAGGLDPSEMEDEERLMQIKDSLMSFGCAEELIRILSDNSVKYRGKTIAIEVVGRLKCRKAVPALIGLLKTDIRDIRRASIKALSEFDSSEVRETLLDAVEDYDGHIRKEAVIALGRICDRSAFKPILNLLRVEKYRDVIEESIKALLSIDSSSFLSRLNEFNPVVKEMVSRFAPEMERIC